MVIDSGLLFLGKAASDEQARLRWLRNGGIKYHAVPLAIGDINGCAIACNCRSTGGSIRGISQLPVRWPFLRDQFAVKETLFGMPVSEIIIPGTWEMHAVVFDVPLATAQKAMKRRFGTTFAPSAKSAAGDAPALEMFNKDPTRSALYCDGHEPGAD